MASLTETFPTIEDFDRASPEAAGASLVSLLQSNREYKTRFAPANMVKDVLHLYGKQESELPKILPAYSEGIGWAQANLLIVPALSEPYGWMTLTRAGREFDADRDLPLLKLRNALPHELLHEKIRSASYDIYLTGRFEAAVFEAFKVVEVSVRHAARYTAEQYGTDMISKAFNPDHGPLRDGSTDAERQAMLRLMSGAHGVFKNPRSHRNLDLKDPIEAAEMLIIASHLVRVVEARRILN